MLTTHDGPAVIDAKARCWSKIAIFAPDRNSSSEHCYKVWYVKTRMVWLPNGENFLSYTVTRFDTIHERDRQHKTDGQTDKHHTMA